MPSIRAPSPQSRALSEGSTKVRKSKIGSTNQTTGNKGLSELDNSVPSILRNISHSLPSGTPKVQQRGMNGRNISDQHGGTSEGVTRDRDAARLRKTPGSIGSYKSKIQAARG